MSVSCVSDGLKMLSVTSFVLMGNLTTTDVFEWMSKYPLILRAISVIGRLGNDIVGHEVSVNASIKCIAGTHII